METAFRFNAESICKNVLLIDDEEIDLFINEKIITSSNFAAKVHKVQSGRIAIDYLKKMKDSHELPELIFLDLNMPVMNGFDFLVAFERLPDEITSRCKIVILTSSSSDQDKSRAMKYTTVLKYIYKPINEVLLKELKKISDMKAEAGSINHIVQNFKNSQLKKAAGTRLTE